MRILLTKEKIKEIEKDIMTNEQAILYILKELGLKPEIVDTNAINTEQGEQKKMQLGGFKYEPRKRKNRRT